MEVYRYLKNNSKSHKNFQTIKYQKSISNNQSREITNKFDQIDLLDPVWNPIDSRVTACCLMGHYRCRGHKGVHSNGGFVKIGQSQTRRLCCLRTAWMSTCFRLKTDRGPGILNIATANPGLLRHKASFCGYDHLVFFYFLFSSNYKRVDVYMYYRL